MTKAQRKAAKHTPTKASFRQQTKRGGLLVTTELQNALDECKAKVEQISKDCRAKNRKFRDIEFDLENDRERCLHGLATSERSTPSDVRRVTQIFDQPSFFIGGADSNDIVQGALGDCWFLSALATMSTAPGLIEKFCVARDQEVGVYGFIFFRDTAWVVVIIDDLLFTSIPKFEELSYAEKQLYHNDKEQYNRSARKGSKSLYFARSGTQGETWVALIEKAYAKLHGDYASLSGGEACEAIEDLTGGVSSFIPSKDIMDVDKFWKEELLLANHDRLFGCAFDALDNTRSGSGFITVNGLIGSHAYSVLRAVEYSGKRFVVIRNPWGQSEWTGPWSDGSGEWTKEWLPALEALGHSFGNDGEFVMEYKDFLENWEQIDRTLLFDESWIMSSQWLQVTARPLPSVWAYGDVSFTISLPTPTVTVIVLSKLDERYFEEISSPYAWSFDFVLFRKGETTPLATSFHSRFYTRSVNLETTLDAGEYVVHVRLDRKHVRTEEPDRSEWDKRKLSRMMSERAKSQSVATNFNSGAQATNLAIPLDTLAGQDLTELRTKAAEAAKAMKAGDGDKPAGDAGTDAEPEASDKKSKKSRKHKKITITEEVTTKVTVEVDETEAKPGDDEVVDDDGDEAFEDVDDGEGSEGSESSDSEDSDSSEGGSEPETHPDNEDVIFLGVRVYTHKDSPAVVCGQLRYEMATNFAGLALTDL